MSHPAAFTPNRSGANMGSPFELRAGDRFVYEIDGRQGIADEFLQDGDAYVTWDDGTFGTIKWNHMRPVKREFGWPSTRHPPATEIVDWSKYKPVAVTGKTFRNERVTLDGFAYANCEFYNVTFVYNGKTPIQFAHNKVYGASAFATDTPAVIGTIAWLQGFNLLSENIKLELPAGAKVERGTQIK